MTTKHFTSFLLFLLVSHTLLGQIKHETKVEIGSIFSSHYQVSYEALLSNRLGLELDLEFDLSDVFISDTRPNSFTFEEFSQTSLLPRLGIKYYFTKEPQTFKGFNLGVLIGGYYLVSREDQYYIRYEEIRGMPPSERLQEEGTIKALTYGVQSGYKFLFKDHWIVELQLYLTVDDFVGTGSDKLDYLFNLDGYFKLGYRF